MTWKLILRFSGRHWATLAGDYTQDIIIYISCSKGLRRLDDGVTSVLITRQRREIQVGSIFRSITLFDTLKIAFDVLIPASSTLTLSLDWTGHAHRYMTALSLICESHVLLPSGFSSRTDRTGGSLTSLIVLIAAGCFRACIIFVVSNRVLIGASPILPVIRISVPALTVGLATAAGVSVPLLVHLLAAMSSSAEGSLSLSSSYVVGVAFHPLGG